MRILESSDWHCGPDELTPEAREFIRLGKKIGALLIGNGDLFNFLPLGRDKYRKAKVFKEFVEELNGYPFVYITGNHDPFFWVVEELSGIPNIKILKGAEILSGGRRYHFFHGHQRSEWSILQHIAPDIVEFMVDNFPRQWYWLCEKLGWLSFYQKLKAQLGGQKERNKFNAMTLAVQDAWRKYAEKREISVVIGHTHKATLSYWFDFDRKKNFLVDGGNLGDGTFCRIDERGAELICFEDL